MLLALQFNIKVPGQMLLFCLLKEVCQDVIAMLSRKKKKVEKEWSSRDQENRLETSHQRHSILGHSLNTAKSGACPQTAVTAIHRTEPTCREEVGK